MTLQGALRYDNAWSYFLEQRVGPTRFAAGRHRLSRRRKASQASTTSRRALGVAYDLFGNGRTSIKVNAGRYLEAAAALGIYSASNPVTRISTSASRTWTDSNGNWVPDCDLLNPAAQNLTASRRRQLRGARATRTSAARHVQQHHRSRRARRVGRPLGRLGLRRIDSAGGAAAGLGGGRLLPPLAGELHDQRQPRASRPRNFDRFSITAPRDPRLPDGGGYVHRRISTT